MLIDSHAHLDFYDDPAPILARAAAAGVHQILAIGIGDGPLTMHRALEIARNHNQVYASAGIHPQEAAQASPEALKTLRALAQEPKCIAIGEIGLDYYHLDNPDILTQQAVFAAQLEIAADHHKPILIHCRTSELASTEVKLRFKGQDAFADLMEIIHTRWTKYGIPGVMHCFSGSLAESQQALAAGFYLSFAGNLTYPRSEGIREAAKAAPANRILVETDCPFLAPIPLRGQQNEPAFVTHTAAFLAQLRGLTPEDLAAQTTQNFHTLFPQTGPALPHH
jgi:TatD DNase family protein